MSTVPNNLPVQLTSFVGRVREIAEAKRLLSGTRLLTLTGAGGCGKTRLALRVATDLLMPDGGRGITVNALSPGFTEDSVLNSLPSEAQDLIRGWHESGWTPMRRLGTPADIGNAAALFCSDAAGWITGQVIDVDGGASIVSAGLPLPIQQG